MDWGEIIGHQREIEVLRAGLARGRTAHAYLFVGEPGVGKRTVADVFTRALVCEAEGESHPCGHCRSCRQDLANHPDVITIEPSGASIKIEQVRAVQRELLFSPVRGKRKVIRFILADDLTEQAQNALLKSLEEPPAFACFLLLSRHLHAILPTVRSRCVLIRFGRVPAKEIAAALERRGYAAEAARTLAALACGRPGAVAEVEAALTTERRKQAASWAQQLLHSPTAVWFVGEALEKEREQALLYVDLLIMWFRDLLLVRTGRPEAAANQDMLDVLEREAAKLAPDGLAAAVKALLELKEQWNANANFRLALDVALINIQRGLQSA